MCPTQTTDNKSCTDATKNSSSHSRLNNCTCSKRTRRHFIFPQNLNRDSLVYFQNQSTGHSRTSLSLKSAPGKCSANTEICFFLLSCMSPKVDCNSQNTTVRFPAHGSCPHTIEKE